MIDTNVKVALKRLQRAWTHPPLKADEISDWEAMFSEISIDDFETVVVRMVEGGVQYRPSWNAFKAAVKALQPRPANNGDPEPHYQPCSGERASELAAEIRSKNPKLWRKSGRTDNHGRVDSEMAG